VPLSILIGLIVVWQFLLLRCPERPQQINIESATYISNLYPWPNAKIPLACQTMAFLKSPFAPKMIYHQDDVFKEDGYPILGGWRREGVVTVGIGLIDEIYHQFPEPVKPGNMPRLAKAFSLYIDGKELQMGYIGFREIDREAHFATILDPFLWPGEHSGKIVILLPTGEKLEYEWNFEITWW
jgi:hypothetical protein